MSIHTLFKISLIETAWESSYGRAPTLHTQTATIVSNPPPYIKRIKCYKVDSARLILGSCFVSMNSFVYVIHIDP